jgi:ClpP class serine protease
MIGSIGTLCRMTYQPLELHTVKSAELKTIAQGSMSLAQLEDIAASVRTFFEQFRNAIERGRPRLDVDAVATGQMWIGQGAVEAGIADQIGGLQGVIDTYGDDEFDDDGALEMLYQSESDYAVL